MPSILTLVAVVAAVAAVAAVAWAISQTAWGRAGLAAVGTFLVVMFAVAHANAPVATSEPRQGAVPGCAYAEFPVCSPFKDYYEANAWYYGPAISSAAQRDGFLIQCFRRGCLGYDPGNPPGWEVQGLLLGERYLQQKKVTPEPINVPPLLSAWFADKARAGADQLKLMGQPLGNMHADEFACDAVVYQMAVICLPPAGTADINAIRLASLGELVNPVHPLPEMPWWAAPFVQIALLLGSLAISGFSIARGFLDPDDGGI